MFAGVLQISVAGMSLKWLTSLILHQFCSHPNHHLAKGQSMFFLPFTFSSCTVHRKNEERERERERERDVSSCFSLKHKLLGQLNSGAKVSVDAHLDYGQGLWRCVEGCNWGWWFGWANLELEDKVGANFRCVSLCQQEDRCCGCCPWCNVCYHTPHCSWDTTGMWQSASGKCWRPWFWRYHYFLSSHTFCKCLLKYSKICCWLLYTWWNCSWSVEHQWG